MIPHRATSKSRKKVVVISRIVSMVVMVSMFWSQTVVLAQPQAAAPVMPAAPAAPSTAAPVVQAPSEKKSAPATLTIPAGTAIPLTLLTPIRKSMMRTGGAVRAEVMFPVTVGSRIAIPVGTFVDGTIDPVPAQAKPSGAFALIHFTQLTFATGYTAQLSASAESAMLETPGSGGAKDAAYAGGARLVEATYSPGASGPPRFVPVDEYCPGPPFPCVEEPPSQRVGPNPVAIALGMVGGFVLLVTGILLLMHHQNAKTDDLLLADGIQMQMTLQQPLTLDAAKVSQAAAVAGTI
jgi:hypothetical protein